jgi:hypothetical protein
MKRVAENVPDLRFVSREAAARVSGALQGVSGSTGCRRAKRGSDARLQNRQCALNVVILLRRLDPSIALQSLLELKPSQRKHVRIIGVFELALSVGGLHLEVEAGGMRARPDLALKALTIALEKRQHQLIYRQVCA